MTLTVFTTVFGNTDPLHEPQATEGGRFVCFTDQPLTSRHWEIRRMPLQDQPTRAGRMMKIRSHATFPEAHATLWIDANFTLLTSPAELLEKYRAPFVRFRHRDRTRITTEAKEIVRLGKAKPDAIARQLAAYHADGFDTEANPMHELSCNGVLLRRHTPEVVALNEAWARELATHTLRDQMSLDYVAWKQGFELAAWPGCHSDNPHFRFTYYRRPTNDF